MENSNIMIVINELDSTCGISDEELKQRFKETICIDNEIKKIKGLPIAGYDDVSKIDTMVSSLGGDTCTD